MSDHEHADVLIVGAGAAGAVAGLRLAKSGLKVITLEQGHWQDRGSYRGSEWDAELASTKKYATNPNIRNAPDDYPVDTSESDMNILNFCGVGGSTILYNAVWIRMIDEHFRTKSITGMGADWPISYADLKSFYERTDLEIGTSGLDGNPAYPEGQAPPLPPFPLGEGGMAVARAMAQRGWHWWPDTNAIVTAPYDGRYGCVQRGSCPSGCNEGAKSSVDLTHWQKFTKAGGKLITGARVHRIHLDSKGLASCVEWWDEDGQGHVQSADIIIIACNGIGTPRLLLNSRNNDHPNGIANSSSLVGRGLMLHPISIVAGVFDLPLQAWQGHNGSILQSLEFAKDDPSRGFRLGAKWALHPSSVGPIQESTALMLRKTHPSRHHQDFQTRFGHTLHWTIMCEDICNDENRVVLSNDYKDSSGMPAAKIIYRLDQNSRKNLDYNVKLASEIFKEAGAKIVEAKNPSASNAHLMGTARMGADARTSVVNSWCFSHDVPNLAIIDGSVFPSSGSVNPTSTICALSLRTAEYIIDNFKNFQKPSAAKITPQKGLAKNTASSVVKETLCLDQQQIDLVSEIAEIMIPETDSISARQTIGEEKIKRIFKSRPDLYLSVCHSIRCICNHKNNENDLEALLKNIDDSILQPLFFFISACYYTDDRVLKTIGYEGRVARPVTVERYPAYIEEGLLDHLI